MRVSGRISYVHVPDEKRRKLNLKLEKCVLVGYSYEQKSYKCYNPRTKQVRVNRDVVFDESPSWYLPSTPNLNSNLSSEDEVSEAEMPPDECEIETLEASPILFRLSRLNERLSRRDPLDAETSSSGHSVVHSPRRKLRRRLTRKENGKKKMPAYDTDRVESNRRESDSKKVKPVSARKASSSANEQLRRSTRQKNPVV